MASNVSTPLLGAVDTAVIGRIPDPAHLGAVALGALVFSFVFWGFGFLRMGTTGLTAQALGARDGAEVRACLGRAVAIALLASAAILAFQGPIAWIAFRVLDASPQVEELARDYVLVRIWGAPATLMNYGILGWMVGLGRTRLALLLQVLLNGSNMALDAWLVLGLGWGVEGVAMGSVLAEHIALLAGFGAVRWMVRPQDPEPILDEGSFFDPTGLWQPAKLRRTLTLHRDILVRSLSMVAVFGWFTAAGATMGDGVLAANAVLMQLVSFSSFFLDGIAFATEALVGRAIGAGDRVGFRLTVRRTTAQAAGLAVALSVLYGLTGGPLVALLTVDETTRSLAGDVLPWAALAPLAGVWAFQLDGVFIGATRGREMRDAMLVSLGIFLVGWWVLRPWGHHGLWAALYVHYAARTLTLGASLFRRPPVDAVAEVG